MNASPQLPARSTKIKCVKRVFACVRSADGRVWVSVCGGRLVCVQQISQQAPTSAWMWGRLAKFVQGIGNERPLATPEVLFWPGVNVVPRCDPLWLTGARVVACGPLFLDAPPGMGRPASHARRQRPGDHLRAGPALPSSRREVGELCLLTHVSGDDLLR